jgi:hypothetical protein
MRQHSQFPTEAPSLLPNPQISPSSEDIDVEPVAGRFLMQEQWKREERRRYLV